MLFLKNIIKSFLNQSVKFFIVESPFQLDLLNKYLSSNHIKSYFIIIRLNNVQTNDMLLKKKLVNFDRNSIYLTSVPRENIKKLTLYYMIISFYILKLRPNYVGVFNHRSFITKIMKLFVHNLYFFDDGMASIENYQIAKKNNQTVNFTTIFDLKKTKTINIEKLDYSFKNIEIQDDSKVYIIGSALDFNNVISRSDYVNVIRYICDIFKDKHVEFFPHRHESEELLEEVNRFVHITTPNVDFESYINMTNVNPRRIIGFNSTLMYILSRYYGCNVLSIDITECIEGMRKKEEFEITYKYFSDVGGIDVFKYHN